MANVFNEFYGEIPVSLNRAIKANNVSPSDFSMMEYEGLSHDQMLALIKQHSPNKNFDVFAALRGF